MTAFGEVFKKFPQSVPFHFTGSASLPGRFTDLTTRILLSRRRENTSGPLDDPQFSREEDGGLANYSPDASGE